jgi:shikimate kinase
MAGVGKSFIGKRLACKMGCDYIEADQLITAETQKAGLDRDQLTDDEFIRMEEKVMLGLCDKRNSIIDTGGSVVYSRNAMESLKSNSVIVYLEDDVEAIKKRFESRSGHRLIGLENKSFCELFQERKELYERYADIAVDVSIDMRPESIIEKIIREINKLTKKIYEAI